MEDLLEGLLELAIQEATIKARDIVKLRGGDKAAYVAKAREAAEKVHRNLPIPFISISVFINGMCFRQRN